MAVIAGARTWHQVRATVRAGFYPVMKVSWITSPLALAFAQKFLPEATWVPFFNVVAFVIGTYINTHTKKKRLAALRRKVSRSFPFSSPAAGAWLFLCQTRVLFGCADLFPSIASRRRAKLLWSQRRLPRRPS